MRYFFHIAYFSYINLIIAAAVVLPLHVLRLWEICQPVSSCCVSFVKVALKNHLRFGVVVYFSARVIQ